MEPKDSVQTEENREEGIRANYYRVQTGRDL